MNELAPPADALERLRNAPLEVIGRMPWASNGTFLVRLLGPDDNPPVDVDADVDPFDDPRPHAIYKPVRGERPLWDFEPGLHRREVAAYELGEALGFACVPPTAIREDAPLGVGSLQWFIRADHREHYFTMVEQRPDLHDQLRDIAVFDLLANNTDRKSGHCLLAGDRVWAIDNGLCFATDFKLRTVIWEFAGEALSDRQLTAVSRLADEIPAAIRAQLADDEVDALAARAGALAADGVLPADPSGQRYPWPLV
ncbi:MAG: SCO1664 family protein [Desertimonas sp.]